MDRDRMAARLELGDHDFLRHIDPKTVDLREVRYLGEDAAHQLGVISRDMGLLHFAEQLFALSIEQGVEPWARESLLRLLDLLRTQERYAELESRAVAGRSRYGDDQAVLRRLLEALYRQERDAELLDLILDADRDAEWALWRAVSASRQDEAGWPDRYRELYRDYPAAEAHSRVWIYLQANPDVAGAFAGEELAFFAAKHLQAERRYAESAEAFRSLASALLRDAPERQQAGALPAWSGLVLSPAGLLDFYRAGSYSGRQSASAASLAALEAVAPADLGPLALEYAGRLYRTAGAYALAIPLLERSVELQPAEEAKRARWYLLSSHVRSNPVRAAAVLGDMAAALGDPPYFSDVISELGGALAGAGRWDVFLRVYESLAGIATAGALAEYELVLADAARAGLLPEEADRRDAARREWLERAAAQTEDLFAALVAAAILGEPGERVLALANGEAAGGTADEAPSFPVPPAAGAGGAPGEAGEAGVEGVEGVDGVEGMDDLLIRSAMKYGLLEEAYGIAVSGSRIGREVMGALSDRLASAGRFRESIRVALRMTPGGPARTDPVVLRRYPLAYASLVEEVLSREPLDRWVFYALVREESLFDPEIVSVAGAVGLTQLLPSTASDVARRMRLEVTSLTDPALNLTLGARYLSMLQEQFGDLVKALAAYNAGQGRVRGWEREWPQLDLLLFHRAIPFEETYRHIRKIVVSAAYYGYLYGNQDPAQTVRTFLGDLETMQ